MYRKNFVGIFLLVFLLGLFFQYNRMDGFLYLSAVKSKDAKAGWNLENSQQDKAALARDTFLIIYNPENVRSTLMQHELKKMLEGQKKSAVIVRSSEIPEITKAQYTGVILATGQISQVAALSAVEDYAEEGGTVLILQGLMDDTLPEAFLHEIGIASLGQAKDVPGIRVKTDFLFGAKDFSMDVPGYQTNAREVVLEPSDAAEKVPFINN